MTLTLSKTSSPLARGEHELVRAARAGDDRAFEDLYARYRDRILSFIVSKVHDHGRAEDIAQDVFMSALRRLRASDQTIAFKPWIYEIAKNACIDEFRRGSRSREVPLETDGEFVTDRQPTLSVVTPVTAVESKQRLDDLRGAFGGLSANHHQLLVMREFEGMTYDEIGDRLGMTRQMVESGLFRARRKLSEEYEELASGRRCEQMQEAIEAGTMQSIRALGVRERRRAARHLAHCQACRHVALMAGVDEALVKPRSIAAKIAAFLPLPLWRWPWRGGRGGPKPGSGSHHLAAGLQNAAGLSEPVAGSIVLGPAAAAVAVLALAGGGAGLAHVLSSPGHAHGAAVVRPAAGRAAPARTAAGGAARSTASTPQVGVHRTASYHGIMSALTVASDRSGSRRHSPSQPGSRGSGSGGAASGSGSSAAGTSTAAATSTPSSLSSGVRGTVTHVAGALGAGGVGGAASKTVQGALGGVGAPLSGAGNAVGNVIKTATGTVNNVAGDVGGAVQGVGSAVQGVGAAVPGVVGGAVQGVGGAVKGVGAAVQGVGAAVQGLASGSGASSSSSPSSSSSSPGSNPLSAVTSAVSNTVQDATQPVQSAVGQLAGGLRSK